MHMCAYMVKHSVNNISRNFCDGFPLKAKGVQYLNNYAECVSHHYINMLLSFKTSLDYYIMAVDSTYVYN